MATTHPIGRRHERALGLSMGSPLFLLIVLLVFVPLALGVRLSMQAYSYGIPGGSSAYATTRGCSATPRPSPRRSTRVATSWWRSRWSCCWG